MSSIICVDAAFFWKAIAAPLSCEVNDLVGQFDKIAASLRQVTGADDLLRIQWYDSVDPTGKRENRLLKGMSHISGVSVRQGTVREVNGSFVQKQVDSLLVVDMTLAALTGRVDTIYLLTGDEDMLPGVQAAQAAGTRVVLIQFGTEEPRMFVSHVLRSGVDDVIFIPNETFDGIMFSRSAMMKQMAQAPVAESQPEPEPKRNVPRPPPAVHRPLEPLRFVNQSRYDEVRASADGVAAYAKALCETASPKGKADLLVIISTESLPHPIDQELRALAEHWGADTADMGQRSALRTEFINTLRDNVQETR